MKSLIIRIVCQIKNDKRTLALLVFAPVLVLTLIYFIISDTTYKPTVALVDIPPPITAHLTNDNTISIQDISKDEDIDSYLKQNKADAVIFNNTDGLHIKMLETTNKTAIVTKAVKNAVSALAPQNAAMHTDFVYSSSNESQFNSLGFVFLGILSFFFVFIISGMALVRERTSQTLERMLMTPVRRTGVIAGYTVGYGIYATIQSTVIILYTHYVLGLQSAGSILLCILIMVLMAFVAVSMGALASIFANTEFQVVQFIPIVIVPQVFFSGLIPVDTIPYGIGKLCYIMPVYYACTSLKKVMVESADIVTIAPFLLGLVLFIIALFILNTIALKKYRSL